MAKISGTQRMKQKKARRAAAIAEALKARKKRAEQLGVSPGKVLMMELKEAYQKHQAQKAALAEAAARRAAEAQSSSRWGRSSSGYW